MQSYIIHGGDQETRLAKARELSQVRGVDQFDISILSGDLEEEKATSIGIKEVKALQQRLYLRPYKGTVKSCIIPQAELLTLPAQNALLKVLEEPPGETLIFLLIQNSRALLPTIRSRCSEIDISPHEAPSVFEDEQELIAEWASFKGGSVNEQLKRAQDFAKNKDESITKLKKYLFILSRNLQDSIKNSRGDALVISGDIKIVQETHTLLTTTNTNPRLIFEHLFFSI